MKDDLNSGLGEGLPERKGKGKKEKKKGSLNYEPQGEVARCGRKAKNCDGYYEHGVCPFCNLIDK